jgi:hypothetical protein
MRVRHALATFAVLPVLLFSILPLAPMSLAFEGPSLTTAWSTQA